MILVYIFQKKEVMLSSFRQYGKARYLPHVLQLRLVLEGRAWLIHRAESSLY